MHPFMQDCHDADVSVGHPPPINEVLGVPEVKPFNLELRRDGVRGNAMALDAIKGRKKVGYVAVRLIGAPPLSGIAVDFVQSQGRRLLDPYGHPVRACYGRSPRQR